MVTVRKNNPGFLTDDQVFKAQCVRTYELEKIKQSLRDGLLGDNPHTVVIGPQGSGKSHLLRSVVAHIRTDKELGSYYFPIVFPEESYEISSCGEFWLESLYHLSQQAPPDSRNSLETTYRTYNQLTRDSEDDILAERCIGALIAFARNPSQTPRTRRRELENAV